MGYMYVRVYLLWKRYIYILINIFVLLFTQFCLTLLRKITYIYLYLMYFIYVCVCVFRGATTLRVKGYELIYLPPTYQKTKVNVHRYWNSIWSEWRSLSNFWFSWLEFPPQVCSYLDSSRCLVGIGPMFCPKFLPTGNRTRAVSHNMKSIELGPYK